MKLNLGDTVFFGGFDCTVVRIYTEGGKRWVELEPADKEDPEWPYGPTVVRLMDTFHE